MSSQNREAIVSPIIETKKSVEHIEDIVAVDGMDIMHFGPGGISANMGIDLIAKSDNLCPHGSNPGAPGVWMLFPDGFGFESADGYINAMNLVRRRTLSTNAVAIFRTFAIAGLPDVL